MQAFLYIALTSFYSGGNSRKSRARESQDYEGFLKDHDQETEEEAPESQSKKLLSEFDFAAGLRQSLCPSCIAVVIFINTIIVSPQIARRMNLKRVAT